MFQASADGGDYDDSHRGYCIGMPTRHDLSSRDYNDGPKYRQDLKTEIYDFGSCHIVPSIAIKDRLPPWSSPLLHGASDIGEDGV